MNVGGTEKKTNLYTTGTKNSVQQRSHSFPISVIHSSASIPFYNHALFSASVVSIIPMSLWHLHSGHNAICMLNQFFNFSVSRSYICILPIFKRRNCLKYCCWWWCCRCCCHYVQNSYFICKLHFSFISRARTIHKHTLNCFLFFFSRSE